MMVESGVGRIAIIDPGDTPGRRHHFNAGLAVGAIEPEAGGERAIAWKEEPAYW
jgi:hypothetical protein